MWRSGSGYWRNIHHQYNNDRFEQLGIWLRAQFIQWHNSRPNETTRREPAGWTGAMVLHGLS
jgi:hypothetical protein